MINGFLSGLVVGLLHFRLLEGVCNMQGTNIEPAVFVVTVAVIERWICVPHIIAMMIRTVPVTIGGGCGGRMEGA